MENFQFIEYHRKRDFSKKVNATFEFIKQNFKSLFKSILFIAGPPMLIGSLLIGSFLGDFITMSQKAVVDPLGFQNYFSNVNFWLQFALMMVCVTTSMVVTLSTINNYILLYEEKRSKQIEVSEVWDRVRSTIMMYFTTVFLFLALFIAAYAVIAIIAIAVASVSALAGGILMFFMILFFFFGFFYLTISISLTFIIRSYEKKSFFDSIARSFKLVQGKWWSTFGLIFILYMIMMIISYIPMIPFYIALFINTLHTVSNESLQPPSATAQIWTTISFVFYYLIQMLLSTLPNVGIAFQYFNLVELKESKGLMADIETLGKPNEAARPEENF